MDAQSALRMNGSGSPDLGRMRLTRLNIYSCLSVEFDSCSILVDPSKIPPHIVLSLRPDLVLVSHESMDHFEADVALRFLTSPTTRLVGSWGVMMALAQVLPATDPRWAQIFVGLPGATLAFGDLRIGIEASLHCEYAVPLFFDIRDQRSGFRILNLIDSDVTDRMRAGIDRSPDVLVVPAGIALGASATKAWDMVRLLQPRRVFASHFTHERDDIAALAPAEYAGDRLIICSWHEGVVIEGPRGPRFDPHPRVEWSANAAPAGHRVPAEWMVDRPSSPAVLAELAGAADPNHIATALNFASWTAALGSDAASIRRGVLDASAKAMDAGAEPVVAAYLLALGAALSKAGDAAPGDLDHLVELLDPTRPYVGYWVLECVGRAGLNAALQPTVIEMLDRIAADPDLWGQVGIRRKLMWEVDRLVTSGARWPGLLHLLRRGAEDKNPDVRLLSFKLLPLIGPTRAEGASLLRVGLEDPHEDVIEWAVKAHIDLFDTIDKSARDSLRDELPRLLTHPIYQVRDRASVLAELLAAG